MVIDVKITKSYDASVKLLPVLLTQFAFNCSKSVINLEQVNTGVVRTPGNSL